MTSSIVSIGEALIDLIQGPDGRYSAVPGGAPANVAVTVARLGGPAAFAGRLSRDSFGERLRSRLAANDVDLTWSADASEPTTLAVASLDDTGSAEYAFYLQGTADWGWADGDLDALIADAPDAFHFGSLAAAVEPGRAEIERATRRLDESRRTVVSYDVNCRPAVGFDRDAERARVERQLEPAHLVKASDDDLAWLFPGADADEIAGRWAGGIRFVLVTRGGDGVRLHRPGGDVIDVPAVPVEVVDTVGAGDATCGALLTALGEAGALGRGAQGLAALSVDAWRDALRFAVLVGGETCRRSGAEPPTRAEVDALR
jgi:fructokinase